jgi:hypothetical protein
VNKVGGGGSASTGAARGKEPGKVLSGGAHQIGVVMLRWRKRRSGDAPTATVASDGLQRPEGDRTAPVIEREDRSGPNEEKGGTHTVLTMV